ncbi:uncharacterized protein LOC111332429 [Stylophora pistillata]|uniref:uncharacterized protein LOC111332429 n=1 Tax=Stylophora pistillata TaxID=50429 RepID=UPI000C03BDF6|nr:uncharacterized protein LOC111332429 [Stylophora pistillata]
MADKIDLYKVPIRPIKSGLNKYNIEIKENHGLNEKTGFWWLVFTFDFALEKGIEVRLNNFKYSGSATWTMEIVRCLYLGITCKDEMDSFDMVDELANSYELRRLNDSVGNPERLRKYLEDNIVPLVTRKIKYTRFSPQFSFFLSHKSKHKPLMETFRNGLKFLGYKTWLDKDDIPLASDLQGALKVAVDECDCILVWLNEEYFQSDYCKAELLYANQIGKIILPFGDYRKILGHLKEEFEFLANRLIFDTSKSSFFEVLRRIDNALFEFEKLTI